MIPALELSASEIVEVRLRCAEAAVHEGVFNRDQAMAMFKFVTSVRELTPRERILEALGDAGVR